VGQLSQVVVVDLPWDVARAVPISSENENTWGALLTQEYGHPAVDINNCNLSDKVDKICPQQLHERPMSPVYRL
jgi:hypothetical protein